MKICANWLKLVKIESVIYAICVNFLNFLNFEFSVILGNFFGVLIGDFLFNSNFEIGAVQRNANLVVLEKC